MGSEVSILTTYSQYIRMKIGVLPAIGFPVVMRWSKDLVCFGDL